MFYSSSASSRPSRAHPGVRAILKRNSQFTSDRGLAKNALASLGMGMLLMLGLVCIALSTRDVLATGTVTSMFVFGLYAVALASFHIMEFFMTALFHPDTLNYSGSYIQCFDWVVTILV